MPAWNPSMPWPSTRPGGAQSPHWGGYVKLWARAAIARGSSWHLGPHQYDRLDAGNVLGGAGPTARAGEIERLWIDLSCDVRLVDIAGGASSAQGIFSKPDAAVCTLELADPTGKYDPLSSSSPYAFGGSSRLMPGVPIEVFAEVVDGDDGTVTVIPLFTGKVESWGEDWTPQPAQRTARVVASDETHVWVRYDQPEQVAQGAGETTGQRIARLVGYYGWPGTVEAASSSTVTLAPTTLAQTGWELLNRTIDDELGYVYFTPAGHMRWLNRDAWTTIGAPVLALGCDTLEDYAEEGLADILVDVSATSIDYSIRNAIYAARAGGTQQAVSSAGSIARFGKYDYKRTDLGLATDPQVGAWAGAVLNQYAYPHIALDDVTFRPVLDARSWELYRSTLELRYVSDLVRIVWAPPDRPDDIVDGLVRVVGHTHRITRGSWETKWTTTSATSLNTANVFTLGPDAQDRLSAGFVLA